MNPFIHTGHALAAGAPTIEAIQRMIDGPLAALVGIATAFLLVTIFTAFIFQILRLSFKPEMPLLRKDIMNNIAGLCLMLVGVGLLTTLGFGWLHRAMGGEGALGAHLLQEREINAAAWGGVLERYKSIATFIFALAAITLVLAFILQIVKLGTSAGNPGDREKNIKGVLWTGISAAMLGGLTLIMFLFIDMGAMS